MCTVSYVGEYGRDRIPANQWNPEWWQSYQELMRKAAEFDKLTNQPDCVDPVKVDWMKKMEERMAELEKQQKSRKVRRTNVRI